MTTNPLAYEDDDDDDADDEQLVANLPLCYAYQSKRLPLEPRRQQQQQPQHDNHDHYDDHGYDYGSGLAVDLKRLPGPNNLSGRSR